jgi:hypothetical protein
MMSSDKAPGQSRHKSGYEKIFVTCSAAGLARSHKIIRTEKAIEIQFMRLCSQIHLDDYKKQRSDKQREDRKQKRSEKYRMTIQE